MFCDQPGWTPALLYLSKCCNNLKPPLPQRVPVSTNYSRKKAQKQHTYIGRNKTYILLIFGRSVEFFGKPNAMVNPVINGSSATYSSHVFVCG